MRRSTSNIGGMRHDAVRWPRPSLRQNARRIIGDSAAGDVRGAAQQARGHERANGLQVAAMHRQQRVADGGAHFRQQRRRADSRRSRTAVCGPANIRWCAGRWRAAPSSTSPARIALPVSNSRPLGRAHDEARQVVFALGVQAGHFGGFAADQRAAVVPAAARNAGDRPPRPRCVAVCRPRNSPGKTAARAPCTAISLTQWFTRSSPTVSWRPVRNATFSLVPTPSAELTSTGLAKSRKLDKPRRTSLCR